MGFRFDSLVTAYFLAPLFLLLVIAAIAKFSQKRMLKAGIIYCLILFIPAFFISAADIPFYKQFGERFSSAALEWSESKYFVWKLIFSNFSYWGYLLLFFVFYALYFLLLRFISRRFIASAVVKNHDALQEVKYPLVGGIRRFERVIWGSGIYIIMAALFLLCMRGRVSFKSPMQEGTAFISDYMFINELGLNPVYTFYESLDDDKYSNIKFMNPADAIRNVRTCLNINSLENNSSIARPVSSSAEPRKMNVVVVIMESMCTFKMGDYGGPHLTPQMDSLIDNSLYFNNIYSAGIHTFNGIYSTLYGFPGILHWQPLKELSHIKYDGLSEELKANGYNTIYFTTHDDQFDNVGGFLRYNGFDRIVSQSNYPASAALSVLGVPDHFMFDFSLPVLDSLSNKGSPFLCAYMTASDHGPWIIPKDIPFTPTATNEQDRATQYADWSIGHFLEEASKHSWFKNTIFVFLGDHGLSMGHTYDLSLSYHHIPLIFYSPALFPKPQKVENLGGQVDVFPTLMGLLNLPYENKTMGIDLLKNRRPYIYFSDDDKVGCIGPKYYFIHRMIGNESLYEYVHLSKTDLLKNEPLVADSMRQYVYSMLQATQWVIANGKFGLTAK
ncbi:MAG TPA: LTA synthase family protein [Bacteroidia bacterium]|nr:LTA synthase family protein [Bacteroidia bacterium]